MLKQLVRTWVYLCIVVLCSLPVAAQQVSIKARISQPKAGLQDVLELVYEIENLKGKADFQGPNLNHFMVLDGPSQGSSYQMHNINGQVTQRQVLVTTYIIQPKKTGTFTIGAAHLVVNGKKYASNTVTVDVVKGAATRGHPFDPFRDANRESSREPQPISEADIKKNIFIKVAIDKQQPYLGEQVTASYKLYTRLPMTMSITQLPALNGFWSEDYELPRVPKPVEEIVNGIPYQVFTLKKSALFPQQQGKLTLDVAQAEGTVRIPEKVKGWNPFADNPFFSFNMNDPFFESDFFSGVSFRDVPLKLSSSPVDIRVKPLPGQAPATFTGATGNFTMSDELADRQFTTDDVITYKIKISGTGNTKLVGLPAVQWPDDLGVTEPYSTDSVLARTPEIASQKTITYYLNPSKAGIYKLPVITLSYFNPVTQQYEMLRTGERTITIAQGNKKEQVADMTATTEQQNTAYWLGGLAVLAGAATLVVIWLRKKRRPSQTPSGITTPPSVMTMADRRLRSAQENIRENGTAFYEELNKALWLYISQKYEIGLGALVKTAAIQTLSERGVAQNIISDIHYLTQKCELALYTPINDIEERESLLTRTREVIVALEKSI